MKVGFWCAQLHMHLLPVRNHSFQVEGRRGWGKAEWGIDEQGGEPGGNGLIVEVVTESKPPL